MKTIQIATRNSEDLKAFLQLNDFSVEELSDNVLRIQRHEELPVFVSVAENNMYFEVDLGNVSEIADEQFYFNLLDMNTEILPVSFGINNTNPNDPRLVVVESREVGDMNDQELLAVFDALELATDKAEAFLEECFA